MWKAVIVVGIVLHCWHTHASLWAHAVKITGRAAINSPAQLNVNDG